MVNSLLIMETLLDIVNFINEKSVHNGGHGEIFMSFMILLYEVPSMNTLVSSSNSIENSKSDDLEKSLIYNMNRRGPSMHLCGTPCVISFISDLQSLYSTKCSLNDK